MDRALCRFQKPQSVVVIGGGIAGIATALYLAREGMKVTCLEENPGVALETSYLNGSLACASLTQPWCSKGNLFGFLTQPLNGRSAKEGAIVIKWNEVSSDPQFWRWAFLFARYALSTSRYDECFRASYKLSHFSLKCMEGLEQEFGGIDPSIAAKGLAKGTIQLFPTAEKRIAQTAALSSVVLDLTTVLSADVSDVEPVLDQPELFRGGALVSLSDRSYDIHQYCLGMKRLAEASGVTFLLGQTVKSLVRTNSDKGCAIDMVVLKDGSTVKADAFVVAAGNHSNAFAEWAGDGCHSWPVRGFALEVPVLKSSGGDQGNEAVSLTHNVVDDPRRIYIAPLRAGLVRLSGYCELGARYPDKSQTVDYQPAFALLEQARELLPAGYLVASSDPRIRVHTCWRPQTPDDLPVVGRSARYSNLYYNAGHGHLGLTRAVGSAKLLSEVMATGAVHSTQEFNLDEFAPDRFQLWGSLVRQISRIIK